MALVSIVNLAERLLNQTLNSGQQTQPAAQTPKSSTSSNATNADDQFTPSSQATEATAQDVGLFKVTQFTLFSAAADFILARTAGQTPPQTEAPQSQQPEAATQQNAAAQNNLVVQQNLAAGQNGVLPKNATAEKDTVLNPNSTAAGNSPAQTTAQNAAPNTTQTSAADSANGRAAGSNGAVEIQQQLQSLNASLAALGLSQPDISAIDRIASVINDFNPTAFTSLVYQLEAAAQAAVQQSAASAPTGNAVAATNGTALKADAAAA